MSDLIFNLLYKLEQKEVVEELRRKQLLRDSISHRYKEYPSFIQMLKRNWLALVFLSGKK
ncbi:hypothetical protein [Desulforhopalus sp. 52FAK]